MKVISFVLAMSLTASAFAGVKEDVTALGKLAFGSDVTSVKGKNAEAIFKNFLEDGEELVNKEYADMDYGDEVDEGFTSLKSAIAMGGFAEGMYEEKLEQTEEQDRASLLRELNALKRGWSPLINKLHKQGVKFGYTGHGPGYCGVSFVELIIIDEKEQKVYEVYLSESGEC
ncbi:MAG: hypothetical protein V4598_02650 [Bdellovibrionota bacterium]